MWLCIGGGRLRYCFLVGATHANVHEAVMAACMLGHALSTSARAAAYAPCMVMLPKALDIDWLLPSATTVSEPPDAAATGTAPADAVPRSPTTASL
ncbi:hypothetical protein EON66_04990 [archaeon]|nr:MAG: hypothetical protein EON66_04990 [archaeon]